MNDDKQRLRWAHKRLDWIKNETQKKFNEYVRTVKDKDDPCISCGEFRDLYDAGHYFSIGSSPSVRFDEDNVHKQCRHCNYYRNPNDTDFKANLIKKIGIERFNALEQRAKKSVPRKKIYYIEKYLEYKNKIKEVE